MTTSTSTQPPNLHIPPSTSTTKVRIIDTTSHILNMPMKYFVTPVTPGFTHHTAPSYSFLIEHASKPPILFDLGIRKDFENLAPAIVEGWKKAGFKAQTDKNVREILDEHNYDASSIDAIILSHSHVDHVGDPSTFEKSTKLVVGPGFKDAFLPGYPKDPKGVILESDYAGRELEEVDFEASPFEIAGFKAFDYHGDGSFYLLYSPGHAVAHMCGLARISNSPDRFVFMAGDACHYAGEFRPSEYVPLPGKVDLGPGEGRPNICPGEMFERFLRDGDKGKSFYAHPNEPGGAFNAHDPEEDTKTVKGIQKSDASGDVLMALAHDSSLEGVVDFFPKYLDEFVESGGIQKVRWLFLNDFVKAMNKMEEV